MNKDTKFKKGCIPWNKGMFSSKETRKKISEANKGRIVSKETRKKLSIIHKGRIVSKETREKISQANKGHKGSQFWLGKKRIFKNPEERNRKISKNNARYWLGKKLPKKMKKKCSVSFFTKEKMMGKNNSNWKGGITPNNMKERGSLDYKLWRKSNFERDNFTDQKTGISGGELEVHHINNFAEFPELRLAIDNGITLSKKAHREFHKIYGKKNNTKEQLLEFLKNK